MSVLVKIEATQSAMSATERLIGRYILTHPESMPSLSSSALAHAIGTSQSSIVKFAQKLGYEGFSALKLAVKEAAVKMSDNVTGTLHGTILSDDSLAVVMQKLIGSKLKALRETTEVNDEASIKQALQLLHQARRIHLVGVGASSLVARDFSYKLLKLGHGVLHDSDSHIQLANASTLNPGDVLVAFSYSGNSMETFHIMQLARQRGAAIISITRIADNPISLQADVRLFTVADEDKARSSSITARDAQLMLTDLLFIQLAQQQPDANAYVHNSEAAVAVLKLPVTR